jgi:hypothetical protein
MIDWIPMITQTGFPIVMCVYFMARMERIVKNNTEVLIAVKDRLRRR